MIKLNSKSYENYSSNSESSSQNSQNNQNYQEEFETFAPRKPKDIYSYNRESSQQEDDSQQNQSQHSKINEQQESEDENQNRRHDDESIDVIEARIKKLEVQLSRKLKKLSPDKQMQLQNYDEMKKDSLKSKYHQQLKNNKPIVKQDFKKQSISPKHKKAKSKEKSLTTNINQNKNKSKRVNQPYQLKTIQQVKVPKVSNRKLTQSHQGNFKDVNRLTQESSKRQNEIKNKVTSKSTKKRSCVQKQIQDMDYLNSKIGSNEMTKLQKQIQLLKILESIKGKLKRSINHKLNKLYQDNDKNIQKSKVSTFLLQRGCPANYLN